MKSLLTAVMSTTAVLLAACDGAYYTNTSPEAKPLLNQPREQAFSMSPVKNGGILMRRSDDTPWQAPKREVDTLKEQLAALRSQMGMLYTDQERRLAAKFAQVEDRVLAMRQRELQAAADDAELLVLVKEKFDSIDQNIDFLRNSEAVKRSDRDALLSALDQKFKAVESHLMTKDGENAEKFQQYQQELANYKQTLEADLKTLAATIADDNAVIGREVGRMRDEKEYLLTALDQKFAQLEQDTLTLGENLDVLAAYQQAEQERGRLLAAAVKDTKQALQSDAQTQDQAQQQRIARLNSQIAALKDNTLQLADDMARLRQAQQRGADDVAQMTQEIAGQSQVFEAGIAEVAADNQLLLRVLDQRFADLTTQRSDVMRELQTLQSEQRISEEQVIALQQENRLLNQEIGVLEGRQQGRLDALQAESHNYRQQVIDLQQKTAELGTEVTALAERQSAEVMRIQAENGNLFEATKTEMAALLAETEGLKQSLTDLTAQQQAATQRDADLAASLEVLPSEIAAQKAELAQEIATVKQQLEQAQQNVVARMQTSDGSAASVQAKIAEQGGLHMSSEHITGDTIMMTPPEGGSLLGGYSAEQWIDLQDYQVVVHEENATLEDIMDRLMKRASGYTGPWEVQWKLRRGHDSILAERFSLNVEATFEEFAQYLSNYMQGYRGFPLSFNIFNSERVLVITDEVYQ